MESLASRLEIYDVKYSIMSLHILLVTLFISNKFVKKNNFLIYRRPQSRRIRWKWAGGQLPDYYDSCTKKFFKYLLPSPLNLYILVYLFMYVSAMYFKIKFCYYTRRYIPYFFIYPPSKCNFFFIRLLLKQLFKSNNGEKLFFLLNAWITK